MCVASTSIGFVFSHSDSAELVARWIKWKSTAMIAGSHQGKFLHYPVAMYILLQGSILIKD